MPNIFVSALSRKAVVVVVVLVVVATEKVPIIYSCGHNKRQDKEEEAGEEFRGGWLNWVGVDDSGHFIIIIKTKRQNKRQTHTRDKGLDRGQVSMFRQLLKVKCCDLRI